MADEAPVPTPTTPSNGSGVLNKESLGKAIGTFSDPKAAATSAISNAVTSRLPASGALSGLNSIRNGNIGGAVNAGAGALLATATGGASKVFDAVSSRLGGPDSVTLTKYVVVGVGALVILLIMSVVKGAESNPLGLVTDFSGTISQVTKDNLNVDICQLAGVNDAINQEAQQTAKKNHTENTPVMDDCLKAKAAAATLQRN